MRHIACQCINRHNRVKERPWNGQQQPSKYCVKKAPVFQIPQQQQKKNNSHSRIEKKNNRIKHIADDQEENREKRPAFDDAADD